MKLLLLITLFNIISLSIIHCFTIKLPLIIINKSLIKLLSIVLISYLIRDKYWLLIALNPVY